MRRYACILLALLLAGCAAGQATPGATAPGSASGMPDPSMSADPTTPLGPSAPLEPMSGAPGAASSHPVVPTPSPSATPRPTPTEIVDSRCPTDSPLTVLEHAKAGPYCFQGRDVAVRGWLGRPPAIGWEPPFVVKPWRWPPAGWTLWQRGPGGDDMCGGGEDCAWLALNMPRGATFDWSVAPGWAIVTGHHFDPAAETCYWEDPTGGKLPAVELAREECRYDFVVTSVLADPSR